MRAPRNDRQRQPRRRGFDDDNFFGNTPTPVSFPTFSPSSSAPEAQATVKWFNAEKGYGFAALSDGSGDVFLHVNTLQAAGVQAVSPGATLRVRVGQGPKGRQIDQVVSVDESTAEQPAPRSAAAVLRASATRRWSATASGRPQFRCRDGGNGEMVQP